MRVLVIAVGKVKERGIREAIDDYLGRVRRFVSACDEIELKDAAAGELEARLAKAIPERARVVALEVGGEAWTSEGLAKFVGRCEGGAVPTIAFVIGGAYGLPPAFSAKADVRLSLSPMTLPHRLARLFLAEQIYRAFTILRHAPYSH